MAYIFMDESGNLGFDFKKKKTSRYFVIAFMLINRKEPIEKAVKKIFRSFTPKERKFHHNTLHAYKETPKIRKRFLKVLNEKNITVISLYLNKNKVHTRLQETKHALYNYVTNILLDRLCTKKIIATQQPITLIASLRETNKFLNENFKSYLKNQIRNNHKLDITVKIKSPQDEKCLQAIDIICWAIFRKIEHRDNVYYNLIKPKIMEENPLFP
mgnify:CR=1 FL=1